MHKRKGFTLVELLVVIAIIGVLVALLLPAVQAAREAARRISCANKLKQIGLALHNYHDSNQVFPPGYLADGVASTAPASAETGSGFAWGALTLPYLEQKPLHDRLVFERDCRAPENLAHATEQLSVFRCPSDSGDHRETFDVSSSGNRYEVALANYVGILGYGNVTMTPGNPMGPGVYYRNSKVRFADVRDGASNTIMVGERTQRHKFMANGPTIEAASTWYAAIPGSMRHAGMPGGMASMMEGPGSLVLGHVGQPAMGHMMQMHHTPNHTNHIVNFSSLHPGGIHFVGCDGSVHFLSEDIEFMTFRRLGQRADGDELGPV